jgi:pimeloyl-ACP methyl ester carboxylesterase
MMSSDAASLETDYEQFRRENATLRTLVTLDEVAYEVEYLETESRQASDASSDGSVLVFLPPLGGTAACWFRQLALFKGAKKMRALALGYPSTPTLSQLVACLDLFLDALVVTSKVHFVGAGFGGYVCQLFSQVRPSRVSSLFLLNSYCDLPDRSFLAGFSLLPSFLGGSALVDSLPADSGDPRNAEACAFVRNAALQLPGANQAARLALCSGGSPLVPARLRERFKV